MTPTAEMEEEGVKDEGGQWRDTVQVSSIAVKESAELKKTDRHHMWGLEGSSRLQANLDTPL